MEPTRILQVFTVMNRGGAETMIMNYYRQIDKTKIQFDFLVHRSAPGLYDEEIKQMGGKIHVMPPINPFKPIKYYKKLKAFFHNYPEYQIIHSHINTFSCYPLKVAKEMGIRHRFTHAHIALDPISFNSLIFGKESLKETLKKVFKIYLKKRINLYPSHRFACGQMAGKWLYGNAPFEIMPNAIDPKMFTYREEVAKKYRDKFDLNEKIIIGHVGRFNSQKNHSFLLEIFKEIHDKQQEAELFLIGEGPLKSKIEEKAILLGIGEKVKFLGVRSDVPSLIQMMDILVFPSFYEGLPLTLIEAQSSGIKVFASTGITKEINVTEMVSFLSLQKPAKFWAERILDALPYDRIAQKKEITAAGYNIENSAQKYQEFCLNLSN